MTEDTEQELIEKVALCNHAPANDRRFPSTAQPMFNYLFQLSCQR